ncbi:putative protein [Thiobacillus denitrificans ATCC 25259]|uniref:Probable inorganic carbon transporter subunit DabA n=1 Tax=Thiobacillus denitrificans (strain ATCC 25259 / T1) TaxID=292415 RepID=DABA_THIDA|nr:DUF2309 domain-containing protein [Thiobacillus denitrificans]Q3SFK3.1 RecName: Full=Probable inorganic carbon transporter subunit DabA [Thiobacillus denitrificans ATCC 25259]AAZ98606.1 putative protein [Thiobacillus denitrificans ATCC 25259]
MTLALGRRLKIRALVHVAGEPIPYFWPMRTFIHHNPLYGLEHLPFEQAVAMGERLFRAHGFLPRARQQAYLAAGRVDATVLAAQVARFCADQPEVAGLDLERLLLTLLTDVETPLGAPPTLADAADVHAVLRGAALPAREIPSGALAAQVGSDMPPGRPLYAMLDLLFGTEIGATLDELVIKSCLDFFDEGQSVWQMPGREQGLFRAWSAVARRNLRLFIRGLHIKRILAVDDTPEGIISHVMGELGVPEDDWMNHFTCELTRLHGWAGFIRWRSGAKHYHWTRRYPADLVDYLAIRLVLGLALLREHAARAGTPANLAELARRVESNPAEAYLCREFHGGRVLPEMAHAVEDAIAARRPARTARLLPRYLERKREIEARRHAQSLTRLAERAGMGAALQRLAPDDLARLTALLARFEDEEGRMWLAAREAHYMGRLLPCLDLAPPAPPEKRPFAQVMFCIDVRSERIRRHLEKLGSYQTFGIAGFFGVPVSFIGLEKGSETHLCPVVATPKNVVLELAITRNADDEAFVSTLEQVFHELKASVLSPFITVEAIGLLFGLDMFGKSLAPLAYSRWRERLHPDKPDTRLLLDKLSREQAESIIRSLQRALIVKAVRRELGIPRELLTDEMIRELRETALGNQAQAAGFAQRFELDCDAETGFVERLRQVYRIDRGYARLQLERLGRIGFTLDEQVHFVGQALRSIGLVSGFSRFVLLTGHGSTSENNPYESALDCGACGGNHGITNARVLAQIANKTAVRARLREQGIVIADDTWFVPAFHNTTTDELRLYDLDLLPPSHLVYTERLINGLQAASHLCAAERMRTLQDTPGDADENGDSAGAYRLARRNALDWSQVRPEWGLARNAAFVIGRRDATGGLDLEGRVFLHSYDYRCDPRGRLLENILAGPLVVGQWINMEHYFSAVDNAHYGSGSKVYHNIAGRFGVMTGNLSDLRTGLPAQTVLKDSAPYHEPLRLLTVIEAPFAHARAAVEGVVKVKNLMHNGWLRMAVVDPETRFAYVFEDGGWRQYPHDAVSEAVEEKETVL